jgi:Raf kinase inhibitor-like YbhB/YbcL family protein
MRRLTIATLASLSMLCASVAGAAEFSLSSPDLKAGGKMAIEQVFKGFGCSGGNLSPALAWTGAPAGTKSFALTVFDPDAPTGSGWWHWVAFNIPANTSGLPKGAGDPSKNLMPAGSIQSKTDFGTSGYGGPCPPPGNKPHHYQFTLYALDVDKVEGADATASAAFISFNARFHKLGTATLLGLYGR